MTPINKATPFQAELHQAHKARQARYYRAVKPEPPAAPEPDPPKSLWFGIIAELPTNGSNGLPRVEIVLRTCAEYFGISEIEIKSERRTKKIVRPRQMAMYLAKTLTLRSLPEIGRRLGGRDHTTVLHGIRKVERLIMSDTETAFDAAHIEIMILKGRA